jgi:hypothetical protein
MICAVNKRTKLEEFSPYLNSPFFSQVPNLILWNQRKSVVDAHLNTRKKRQPSSPFVVHFCSWPPLGGSQPLWLSYFFAPTITQCGDCWEPNWILWLVIFGNEPSLLSGFSVLSGGWRFLA